MERVFDLILRFRNLILFLLLQGISLYLIIQINTRHNIVFGELAQNMTSSFQESRGRVFAYFNLIDENDKLLYQIKEIRQEYLKVRDELTLYKNQLPLKLEYRLIPDSLLPAEEFKFIPAQVVNNSLDKSYNFLTINKGYLNGVRKGMGVISEEGVLGQVVSVTDNYAMAMSILNKNFKLSAKIYQENFFGSLSWSGGSPEYADLEYIPLHVNIKEGDTIVTSGFSSIFPEGFRVGIIEEFEEKSEDGFYKIRVKLNSRPGNAYHVYVLSNMHRAEIDSLEKRISTYQ
jgi:rod shape-determining protein MreC